MKPGLKILLFTSAFFTLAASMFLPIYAVFVKEIGGDLLTAGYTYAAFAITMGLIMFLISRWEDHVKHQEKLIIIGDLIRTLGFFTYIFVARPIHLFIAQIILGIGAAIEFPAYDGLYSKLLDRGKYVSEWGMWESMTFIVTAIAALIGGYIATFFGFRSMFVFMFLASLIGSFISFSLLRYHRNHLKMKKR